MTIVIYFKDHAPIRYSGSKFDCDISVMNARLYKGYVSYEVVPDPKKPEQVKEEA